MSVIRSFVSCEPVGATVLFLVVAVFSFTPMSSAQTGASGFPIIVDNPSNIARMKEPVASGISVPVHSGMYVPAGLKLVDSAGVAVPMQAKVLSRWFGQRDDMSKEVKWLLLEFLADVPANGSSTYYIQLGNGPSGMLTVQDAVNEVAVNTGPATFTIDKTAFTFMKSITMGSTTITGGSGSLDIIQHDGVSVPSTLQTTTVEEQGSVRAVVMQRGALPLLGLEFTIRWTFWSGKTECECEFRLENNQAYGEIAGMGSSTHNAHFRDLHLGLRLNGAATNVVTPLATHSVSSTTYHLIQGYDVPNSPLNMLSGFFFTEQVGSGVVSTGERHPGAASVNRSNRGLAIAVDRYWQNYPKSFTAQGNRLMLGLWPGAGNGPIFTGQYGLYAALPVPDPSIPPAAAAPPPALPPVVDSLSLSNYRMEGGRWKTHRFRVAAKNGSGFTQSELDSMATRVNAPLLFRPGVADWNFRTYAFGEVAVERKPWSNVANARYERMMDVLAEDASADCQPTLGHIGYPAFRNRGGTYGGGQFYGWENFGDIVWGDGYSSLHYDIPYSLLMNWFRTGKYAFFDVGREMAAHRRDYDQYHSRDSGDPKRGGQWYEKGWTHGNFIDPQISHTWIHGLLLNYVMTGDEGSYEVAKEVGAFIIRQHPETWSGYWGERILGWALEGLCNLYQYLGDATYKNVAIGAAHRWVTLEMQQGSHGYVINYGFSSNPHCQVWMHAIVMNALAKYWLMTGDGYVLPSMDRMAQWMIQDTIATYPSGPSNARTVGSIWADWAPGFVNEASVHHTWGFAQALGYASICLDNYGYFQVADDFWQSVTRYHQVPASSGAPRNYDAASSWSVIAYRMMQFPNSESKIHGNIGLWGQTMVALEWVWRGL